MGEVKVKFSGAVFVCFFEVHKRIFGISKGLPEGSELVDIAYDKNTNKGEATFSHESFAEVPDGGDPPYVNVEYVAYEIIPEGTKQ
jgi:hypothetical protein